MKARITGTLIENQNIRIETANLNAMEPRAVFLDIFKTYGDNSTLNISLTPSEGRFLRDRLNELYPLRGDVAITQCAVAIENEESLPEGAPVIDVE